MAGITIDRKLLLSSQACIIRRVQNKSGAALAAGDVVIEDTTNSSPTITCVTTTSSQDDKKVYGMMLQTVADGALGECLLEGPTDLLKVNGTTDIAKGDLLSTFTSAGIAAKATAGKGGVFARALEAYTANDSLGVIDAYLFRAPQVDGSGAAGVVGNMAAAGTGTANVIGVDSGWTPTDHVHALGTHTHAGATTGAQIGPTAFANNAFTADAAGRAPFTDGIWTTAKLAAGIISADAAGRALFAAGVLDVTTFQSAVAAAILSANATGRAFMATDYFNAAHVATAFATNSLDATNCADIIADNAIPGSKVNWSYGATASTITPDDSAAAGTAGTVSRSDHVHANTCAAPSAGLAAADAEGAATSFARSNHVHKATVTDAVDFTFGASDDAGFRWSTSDADNHAFVAFLGASKALHITDTVATDWNVAAYSHPTLVVHSNTTPATDYVKLSHDATTATLEAVGGTLDLIGVGSVTVNTGNADVDFIVKTDTAGVAFTADAGLDVFVFGGAASNVRLVNIARPARTAVAATTIWADLHVAPDGAFTTENNTITYSVIASGYFAEPNITKGGTDTITVAATVYIAGAPTEGATNGSLVIGAGNNYVLADDAEWVWGAGKDFGLLWSTADADNHAAVLYLGASNSLHLSQSGDKATDWNVAAETHPTLYIHSATTPITDYIRLHHDGTSARFRVFGGDFTVLLGGTAKLDVAAAATQLYGNTLQGTDQANGDFTLDATSSGTIATSYIIAADMIDATAGSVALRVNAGAVGDNGGTNNSINGETVWDSTNGRLYGRYGAAWHYIAITAGFVIPAEEKICSHCNQPIGVGDIVVGAIESLQGDGALHGLWVHQDCLGGLTRNVSHAFKAAPPAPKPAGFPNAAERKVLGVRKEGDKLVPMAS